MADYARAASAAAGVLLSADAGSARTNIRYLIDADPDTRLIRYSVMADRLPCRSVAAFTERYAESEVSYTKYDRRTGTYYVFYNDTLPLRQVRSNLAHEYAHVLLRHTRGNGNNDEENEALCCARLLMCPAPVADVLQLDDVRRYMAVFGVDAELASSALRFRDFDREALEAAAPDLLGRYVTRLALSRGRLSRLARASGSAWLDVWGE